MTDTASSRVVDLETMIVRGCGTTSRSSVGGDTCYKVVCANIRGYNVDRCIEIVAFVIWVAVVGVAGVGGEEDLEKAIGDGGSRTKGNFVLRFDFEIDGRIVNVVAGLDYWTNAKLTVAKDANYGIGVGVDLDAITRSKVGSTNCIGGSRR